MTTASTATARLAQAGTPHPVDLAAVKAKQQAAWSSGDYSVVGTTLQIVGEAPPSAYLEAVITRV
jgi:hypothetical protein